MAKKKREEKPPFDYRGERQKLLAGGPGRIYILRGEEDYLRDRYLAELRALCVEEGTEAFNYHRLEGKDLTMVQVREAVEAMPFMGERTLTEVRDLDINRLPSGEAEILRAMAKDMPDWATLVLVFSPGYELDGRLGTVQALRKNGIDLEFTGPAATELVRWIVRRVEEQGKRIGANTANYLMFVCGSRMNSLLPEIVRIAGAAQGEEITRADIDAMAKKTPEVKVYDMTDALGEKNYDKAAGLLADLMADKEGPPQKLIYIVSDQFRRLYAAKVAEEFRLPDSYITDCVPELARNPYGMSRIRSTCRGFSLERLARAVVLCARCDYGMKDNGPSPEELMKELILRLALDKA